MPWAAAQAEHAQRRNTEGAEAQAHAAIACTAEDAPPGNPQHTSRNIRAKAGAANARMQDFPACTDVSDDPFDLMAAAARCEAVEDFVLEGCLESCFSVEEADDEVGSEPACGVTP